MTLFGKFLEIDREGGECLTYTQSPPMSVQEAESFLREAKIARFCSLNKDGTIHAAPVWYKYENGEIIVATPPASRKARNVRRNENVAILIDICEGGDGMAERCHSLWQSRGDHRRDADSRDCLPTREIQTEERSRGLRQRPVQVDKVGEDNRQTRTHGIIRLQQRRGIPECC